MAPLAVLLLVRGATHSYAVAGVAVGAEAFATAACAPVLGRLVDRVGRRQVIAPLAGTQAVVYVLLVVAADAHAGAALLVALAVVGGALLPPIAPVVRTVLRELFADAGVRETAYSLEAVLQELIWMAGPLVVGLVIALASPEVAVALLGVVCVIGVSVFLRVPILRAPKAGAVSTGRRSALANHELRSMLAPVALTGMGLGATEVGLP